MSLVQESLPDLLMLQVRRTSTSRAWLVEKVDAKLLVTHGNILEYNRSRNTILLNYRVMTLVCSQNTSSII